MQIKGQSTVEWVNRLPHIHTMEHCPAMRTDKLQVLIITKVNHANVILNEGSQRFPPPPKK